METWEYLTMFVWASLDNQGAKEYLKQTWPDWKPDKCSPETMIPQLNALGEKGWELVHMQPVGAGENSDILVGYQNAMNSFWSNIYFCVFKRRKQG